MAFAWKPGGRSRAAAASLAVLSVCTTLLTIIGSATRWPTDFATVYAAARAVADDRSVNVYSYSTLVHLNVTHRYVVGPIFPFTYPPFTLFLFRPLAFLSFDASRVVWTIAQIVLVFGAALLFADAFTRLTTCSDNMARKKLREVLRLTEVRLGLFRLPTLPFAIVTTTLGILLTPASVPYWGVLTITDVFLLALTTATYMRGMYRLGGLSIGLISGFAIWQPLPGVPGLVCAVLLAFAVVGAWRIVVYGVGTAAAAFALSLVIVPPMDFQLMFSQQRLLDGVYATSPHNTSLNGLVASGLTVLEHTGTGTFLQGERLATILAVAAVAAATMAVTVLALFVRRNRGGTLNSEILWPVLAFTLTVPALSPTLVWSTENLLVACSCLLLLGWSLTAAVPRIWNSVGIVGAVVTIALSVVAALSGSDWRYEPQGSVTVVLYLLRPLSVVLFYASGLLVLIGLVSYVIYVQPKLENATQTRVPVRPSVGA